MTRRQRQDALAAYAAEVAGTRFDLDPELEQTGAECLLRNTEWDEEEPTTEPARDNVQVSVSPTSQE